MNLTLSDTVQKYNTMPDSILQSAPANVGGVLTIAGGFGAKLYELLDMGNVNDFLQLILAVGGVVFLWYKIKGQILDNKQKRKNLEK